MIDLDYYKTIASNESEMSEKAHEFKITLRDLITDIEREQKESVPAEMLVRQGRSLPDVACVHVIESRLILSSFWQTHEIYLDEETALKRKDELIIENAKKTNGGYDYRVTSYKTLDDWYAHKQTA
jgi:uncharacterized protein YjcR